MCICNINAASWERVGLGGGMFLGVARCLAAAASHEAFKEKPPKVASPLGTTTQGCSARREAFKESPVTTAWIQQIFPLRKTPWEPVGLSMPHTALRPPGVLGTAAGWQPGSPGIPAARGTLLREKKKKKIPFGALLGDKPQHFEHKRQLQRELESLKGPALPLLPPRRGHRLPCGGAEG